MSSKTSAPRPGKGPLRLGVYGGTFDPVHTGHLLLARDALEQCQLDAVLFVPCARSPLKKFQPLASDSQRLAMLRLALKGEPRFWLSRCELDRPAPSYAIDTARELAEAFPRAELFWIIGHDQWADIARWHQQKELRARVKFILLSRGEGRAVRPSARVLGLPRPRRVDISATEIRHRVNSSLPIDQLVPKSVAAYIARHRFYRP